VVIPNNKIWPNISIRSDYLAFTVTKLIGGSSTVILPSVVFDVLIFCILKEPLVARDLLRLPINKQNEAN